MELTLKHLSRIVCHIGKLHTSSRLYVCSLSVFLLQIMMMMIMMMMMMMMMMMILMMTMMR